MSRTIRRLALLATGAVTLGLLVMSTGAADAAPTPLGVSLSASGTGASAVWSSTGNVVLTLGTPASSTYAQMTITNPPASAPTTAPQFTTDNYAAGSPRWVIIFQNGCYIFGYPQQLGGDANTSFTGTQWEIKGPGCTSSHGLYETYQQALADAYHTTTKVTQAFIVADGDQTAGTQDTLTDIKYNGQSIIGTGLKAWATNRCQTWSTRHWGLRDLGPASAVTVRYYTKRAGKWVWQGKVSAPLGTRTYVVTHDGNYLQARFWNGYANVYVYAQNGVHC